MAQLHFCFFASTASPREGRRTTYTPLSIGGVLCSSAGTGSKVNTPRYSLNFSKHGFLGRIQALIIRVWGQETCRFIFQIETSCYVL